MMPVNKVQTSPSSEVPNTLLVQKVTELQTPSFSAHLSAMLSGGDTTLAPNVSLSTGANGGFAVKVLIGRESELPVMDAAELERVILRLLERIQEGQMNGEEGWQLVSVQQWLVQAEKILFYHPEKGSIAAGTLSGNATGEQGNIAVDSARAQMVLTQFLNALRQNPEAARLQPLVKSFIPAFLPVLESADMPYPHFSANRGERKTSHQAVGQTLDLEQKEDALAKVNEHARHRLIPQYFTESNSDSPAVFGQKPHLTEGLFQNRSGVKPFSFGLTVTDVPIMKESYEISEGPAHDAFHLLGQSSDAKISIREWGPKLPEQSVPVQHFARELGDMIVKNLEVFLKNGVSEAKISLIPEHLGTVDVRISIQNGQVTAHFVAETAYAKDALEAQMAQLRAALQSQGLGVDKIEVTQQSHPQSQMNTALFGGNKQDQPKQYYSEKQKAAHYEEWQDDFSVDPDSSIIPAGMALSRTIDISA